jgi:hypothetical protein
VSSVKYELGFYIPEDILHSHRGVNFKSYKIVWISGTLVTIQLDIWRPQQDGRNMNVL